MFSGLLRNNLKQAGQNSINLKEEIDLLEKYILLEQFRLENQFEFKTTVHNSIDVLVEEFPQFLIQPFIENAIQHGLKDKEGKGFLSINFNIQGEFIEVTIIDNGIGYKASKDLSRKYGSGRKSYGIEITKSRLELYNESDKEAILISDLSEKGEDKNGTEVVILIKRKLE
jgi:sensor histidine kinase YesM